VRAKRRYTLHQGEVLRSRLLSLLAALLILAGILTPVAAGAGGDVVDWPFRFGTPAFAYDEKDGVWATQLGPNEVKAFSVETLVGSDWPANRVDMAPGERTPRRSAIGLPTAAPVRPCCTYLPPPRGA
jgi:hypothetical protein